MTVKEAVRLEYKMNRDEEYVYEIKVDSQRRIEERGKVEEDHDEIFMKMFQRVKDVNLDGSYELEMVVEPEKIIKNKEELNLDAPPQIVNMRMSRAGEVLQTSMPSPATQPSFPKKSLNLGDTWVGESKVNMPERPQPVTLKFNYKLADLEKMKGYNCVRIEVQSPETQIELEEGIVQKILAGGKTYFAHKEGRLVKSEVKTDISIEAPDGRVTNTIRIFVDLAQAPKKDITAGSSDEFLISG